MKHTKGEWFVSGSDQIVSMPSQCKIANRVSGWNQEEAEANAKLIAAAPELLEVLQTIENDDNSIPEWLLVRIKQVIKKATE